MNLRFSFGVLAKREFYHTLLSGYTLSLGEEFAAVRVPPKNTNGDLLLDVSVSPGAKQSGILGYDQWSKT